MVKLFTKDEEEYLEYYILSSGESNFAKAAEFLGCTTKQIHAWRYNYAKNKKIETLRSRYTQKELDLIKRFHGTKSIEEIAIMLNRPKSSVQTIATGKLGLCSVNYPSKYDDQIRKLGKIHTIKEMAEILRLPLASLRSYIYHKKIPYKKESNDRHYWRMDNEVSLKNANSKNSK